MARAKLLGEILVERGLVSEDQLQLALEEQKRTGERLGQVLLQHGFVSSDKVGEVLEIQTGYPYYGIQNSHLEKGVLSLITEDMARRFKIFPVKREGDTLHLAMATPSDLWALDEIKLRTGLDVIPYVCTISEIDYAIHKYYQPELAARATLDEILIKKEQEEEAEVVAAAPPADELAKLTEDPPIVRLVNQILAGAVRYTATDVHLDPQGESVRVRYRVDGMLHDSMEIPASASPQVISRIKVMANLDISERRRPQDGRFTMEVDHKNYDMRISCMPVTDGEKLVIRVLDKAKSLVSFEQLGLTIEEEDLLKRFAEHPHGIILVSGPSGSGKTTTLYAVLQRLNLGTKNIITIEDPVEYRLPGINQIQINPKAGLTFAAGLRSILRQDPDIIMVGEIRDQETAKIAIEAGMTGHLVLSTVHTNDASAAVARLMEMGIELYLLGSCMVGVVSQRLVRTVCPFCCQDDGMSEMLLLELEKVNFPVPPDVNLKRGKGCKQCLETGYKGRVGIFEMIPIKRDIRTLIIQGASADKIKEVAVSLGTNTLYRSGLKKVLSGITTLEEVKRIAYWEEE